MVCPLVWCVGSDAPYLADRVSRQLYAILPWLNYIIKVKQLRRFGVKHRFKFVSHVAHGARIAFGDVPLAACQTA
jgi:hypothetical protein